MKRIVVYAMALLCLAGCHSHTHSHGHAHSHESGGVGEETSNVIHFHDEMREKVDFSTAEVIKVPFGKVIHTVGRLQPRQGTEKAVVAKAGGIVSFAGKPLYEGSSVTSGQILFYIDSETMADGNLSVVYSEARSAYELAKQVYDRKSKLAVDNIVSASELQAAKADLEQKEARFNALTNNFSEGRQAVKAPISGFVTGLQIHDGQYVGAGNTLACISNTREMQVVAEVRMRYFQDLHHIEDAVFRQVNGEASFSLSELGGRVVSYGKAVPEGMTMIPVTFAVTSIPDTPAGAFLDTYIRCAAGDDALVIPSESVIEEMGTTCVYVQIEPEHFEKRQVKLGATDGKNVEVVSGLSEGETVAAKGAVFVKMAASSGKLDAHAGHVH